MMTIVTRVNLPGIGPVCPECLVRGHVAAFRLPPGEVYSFGVAEPPCQLDWDVDAARALIASRPRTPQRLDPRWLEAWLSNRCGPTPQHVDHIPADKLDEPGILVEVLAGPPGAQPEPFRILIDGTHRAARKLREGQDYWAYLLTEDEQRSICTYYSEGRRAELPSFPGQGIDDRQAGIFVVTSTRETDVA
jgi:hypothetical protein